MSIFDLLQNPFGSKGPSLPPTLQVPMAPQSPESELSDFEQKYLTLMKARQAGLGQSGMGTSAMGYGQAPDMQNASSMQGLLGMLGALPQQSAPKPAAEIGVHPGILRLLGG